MDIDILEFLKFIKSMNEYETESTHTKIRISSIERDICSKYNLDESFILHNIKSKNFYDDIPKLSYCISILEESLKGHESLLINKLKTTIRNLKINTLL